MKKIFLAALVAVFGCVNQVFAQTQLATLFRDGDVKTFYGISALRDAHSNAKHGDVITLSSGTFNSVDITKAITLRGAGMQYDSIAKVEPTIIIGSFKLDINNDTTLQGNSLTMEGIYHDYFITLKKPVYNAQFVKCRFYEIGKTVTSNVLGNSLRNTTFINCLISGKLYAEENASITCVNSYIDNPYQSTSDSDKDNANFEFHNCVVYMGHSDYNPSHSTYRNCIIRGVSGYNIQSTSVAYNCIGLNNSNMFNSMSNNSNTYVSNASSVFKTWTSTSGVYNFLIENLELTDAAKTKYLGADGTQVGIYGGSIPFTARPSNPQITKLNVASKSTADGKLSVDIEVKAAE